MDDLISFIVPVYNVENYLERCISSIFNQPYENIEIILSDDGSTDSSGVICDKLSKQDSRIRVIHEKNEGLSEARNRGIKKAKGKYICFVDSDDWIDKDYVLKLYYAIRKTHADIAECKYVRAKDINQTNSKNGQITCLDNMSALELLCNESYANHIVAWNKLYKKELFNDILFPIGKLHEDEFTTHKLFLKANKVAFVNDELYFYFVNESSIMTSKIKLNRLDSVDALLERIIFFKDNGYDELSKKTSYLLFKLYCDFASLDKPCFYNYEAFFNLLNDRYLSSRIFINKKTLNLVEKYYFYKSRKNVTKLKNTKNNNYYFQRLKQKVSSFKTKLTIKHKTKWSKLFKKARKSEKPLAIILCSVKYLNYGDLAIGEAINQFLNKNYSVIEISQKDTGNNIKKLVQLIKKDDLICLPGGGNVGDVWKYDENLRRLIIKSFSNNKIVVFPQSINYLNVEDDYFISSKEIYEKHNNLILCVRDKDSLLKANSYYPNLNTILIPDSVFLLNTDSIKPTRNKDIALCFRDDKEQSLDSINKAINIIDMLDQSKIPFDNITTVNNGNISLLNRKDVVYKKLKEVSEYKLIITDRLHCVIFCALTATPCIALNSNNNKIKNFINTWLPNKKFILYLDSHDKIDKTIIDNLKKLNCQKIELSNEFVQLEGLING